MRATAYSLSLSLSQYQSKPQSKSAIAQGPRILKVMSLAGLPNPNCAQGLPV